VEKRKAEISRNRSGEGISKNEKPIRYASVEQDRPAFQLFQHEEVIHSLQSAQQVDRETLTNKVNRIHFTNGYIYVQLRYPGYEKTVLVRAYPEASLGNEVTCRWAEDHVSGVKAEGCQFLHLVIDDGRSMILVPAVLKKISGKFLSVKLPGRGYAIGHRKARRYVCHGVTIELMQGNFQATGELLDYSPVGLRIRLSSGSSSSFHWINPDAVVNIDIRRDERILFSAMCRCIRQQGEFHEREMVLAPVDGHIEEVKRKQFRNPRRHLVPSPTLIFDHPLLKKRIRLEVCDISTTGFSVYEQADEGTLMPGMILPELSIDFAGTSKLKCTAQVIYRLETEEPTVRCGLAIHDMDMNSYSHLTHILSNALDRHTYISGELDMDALWEFFFETGFIYPMKYRLIQSYREDFKKTYRKIYQESPGIAQHFTCQMNGRIYGYISMVRAYEKAWMIHHHAARSMPGKRPGFMVLTQVLHYLNDLCRLPSAKIDYVFSYFRPENKFPDRVFGDFARALENSNGSSLDLFSYLVYPTLSMGARLPRGWFLQKCSSHDLFELGRFYDNYSGGLLLEVLGLGGKNSSDESLEKLYSSLDLIRRWTPYSLIHYGKLHAVLIVNQSSLGINFSELLNSIKVLITNSEGLPWEILATAINQLTGVYERERVPILIYPSDYLKANDVPFETKKYLLWIYDARLIKQFTEYLHRRFGMGYW
jgi:hypothetical protein